ncbi:MAG: N5-carboxyaminoimidazole ribonucleotide mutase [Methanonatronarchaeales archaeon]|nr:N5-carboxyaminoimidazole ribonucleotide mutase [Methanonatronarchaeales archaeon]
MVDVAVIRGSDSDTHVADGAEEVLSDEGISFDSRVISAHRNPDELEEYVKSSDALLFIGIAGLSAALPGVIASLTDRPVIGVPVDVKLGGLDALLSISQMPPGNPVACVGIDRGDVAAQLAVRILGIGET